MQGKTGKKKWMPIQTKTSCLLTYKGCLICKLITSVCLGTYEYKKKFYLLQAVIGMKAGLSQITAKMLKTKPAHLLYNFSSF